MTRDGGGILYCRSSLVHGPDWTLSTFSGEHANTIDVITQMSERLPGPQPKFVWNTPFEFAATATSVTGWPQVAFSVFAAEGAASGGNCVGYARCHVPLTAGRHTLQLSVMQPVQSTSSRQLLSLVSGHKTELRDAPGFLCHCQDRAVVTAKPLSGKLTVSFDVAISGRTAMGYNR